jgi:hypothetical protein
MRICAKKLRWYGQPASDEFWIVKYRQHLRNAHEASAKASRVVKGKPPRVLPLDMREGLTCGGPALAALLATIGNPDETDARVSPIWRRGLVVPPLSGRGREHDLAPVSGQSAAKLCTLVVSRWSRLL